MKVALDTRQGKEWFGAAPPDLSVIARSRASGAGGSGADYLYTYMRSFYRDDTKATGWNNLVFPSVAMPHVLWELQGQQRAVFVEKRRIRTTRRRRSTLQRVRADHQGTLDARPTTARWPIWWRSCSGWASRRRISACASASGCCCFWPCSPSSPGA